MSGSASLTLEQGILQHTLGIAAMAFPARVYVALCAASLPPSETIGGVEAFGGGYARQAATFALLASPTNIAANTQSVEFPLATAAWGELGYFEIWTAQAGGSRLYWGGLVDPVSGDTTTLDVSAGDIVRFSAGTLAVQAVGVTATASAGVSSFNTRTGAVILSNSDVVGVLPPSANPPLMNGVAAVGISAAWARGDHVHPSDGAAPNNVGRNLVHNPLFNVAQRAAGPFSINNGYTLDRWNMGVGGGTGSVSQQPFIDATRAQIGDESAAYALSYAFTGTSGASDYILLQQPVERLRRLSGKTVNVSFWAAATSGTPKIGVCLEQNFGGGGSPSAFVPGVGRTVTVSTTWARYSLTFAVPSIAGKTLGTNSSDSTILAFWLSAGSSLATRSGNPGVQSGTIQLWGVQLEIGSAATPLEKPDPRYDLANCQRFYQTGVFLTTGYAGGVAITAQEMLLPVTMRAAPTVTPTTTTNTNCSVATVLTAGPGNVAFQTTPTAPGAIWLAGNFSASADL